MTDTRAVDAHHHVRRTVGEALGVAVTDFRCRACVHPRGPAEQSVTPSIVFVRRGVFVRTQGRDSLIADANHIVFFNPAEPYHIEHPVAGGDDCTILSLPPAVALEIASRVSPAAAERPDRPFPIGAVLGSARALRLHYELLAAADTGPRPAMEAILADLLHEVVRCAHAVDRTRAPAREGARALRQQRHLADAAKIAVHRDLAAPPSLSAMAARFGCSPFHLCRAFRRSAGLSLRAYVTRLRARAAAERVAFGAPNLTRVALDLGFADHSHFTNAFRREWGQPPSHFRAGRLRRIDATGR